MFLDKVLCEKNILQLSILLINSNKKIGGGG